MEQSRAFLGSCTRTRGFGSPPAVDIFAILARAALFCFSLIHNHSRYSHSFSKITFGVNSNQDEGRHLYASRRWCDGQEDVHLHEDVSSSTMIFEDESDSTSVKPAPARCLLRTAIQLSIRLLLDTATSMKAPPARLLTLPLFRDMEAHPAMPLNIPLLQDTAMVMGAQPQLAQKRTLLLATAMDTEAPRASLLSTPLLPDMVTDIHQAHPVQKKHQLLDMAMDTASHPLRQAPRSLPLAMAMDTEAHLAMRLPSARPLLCQSTLTAHQLSQVMAKCPKRPH